MIERMMANIERENIKRRVAKLLNMTVDNGASESEAMMAAQRAAELMAHYDIEAHELSLRYVRAIQQTVTIRKYGNMGIAVSAAYRTARLCDCMSWYNPAQRRRSNPTYTFFGLPADAEIAAYLFSVISNGMLAEIDIYKASPAFRAAKTSGADGRWLIRSFIAGMEDRICARLDALRSEKQQTIQEATGRSLVVVKEDLLKNDFAAIGIKLFSMRRHRASTHSNDAYNSGNAAGDRLPLSPGVGAGPVVGMLK
jgi:hypothetical protein